MRKTRKKNSSICLMPFLQKSSGRRAISGQLNTNAGAIWYDVIFVLTAEQDRRQHRVHKLKA